MTDRSQINIQAEAFRLPVQIAPNSALHNAVYAQAAIHITSLLKRAGTLGRYDAVAWVNIKDEAVNPDHSHGAFHLVRFPEFPPDPTEPTVLRYLISPDGSVNAPECPTIDATPPPSPPPTNS